MIYFLIPVYNEELNVPNLARELLALTLPEKAFFVFSDDGSTDHSVEVIHKHFGQTAYVILGDGQNRGPGYAFNAGFTWILTRAEAGSDCVVTLEADCTSDLQLLPVMLALNKFKFDIVLASVYAQGGGFDRTSIFRQIASSSANLLFRFLFNVRVLTLSSFYRVYSITILQRLAQRQKFLIREPGFICMLEILVNAIEAGARVIEVPMQLHSAKRLGQSKMKVFKTTLEYFKFLIKRKLA